MNYQVSIFKTCFLLFTISYSDNSLKSYKKYLKCSKDEEEMNSRKKRKVDESLLDTVGAVCLDRDGNICSGVSSGGLLLKYPGRIGQVWILCMLLMLLGFFLCLSSVVYFIFVK